MNAELKLTGRVIEIGNLDGGPVIGASFDRGDGRYFEITRLSEEEARAIAPAYDQQVTITISLAERTTSPVSQMTDEQIEKHLSSVQAPESTVAIDEIVASFEDGECEEVFESIKAYGEIYARRALLALAAAAPHAPQTVAEGELPPLPVDLDYLIEYIAQPAVREALRNQISAYARAAMAKGGAANCQDNEGEKA